MTTTPQATAYYAMPERLAHCANIVLLMPLAHSANKKKTLATANIVYRLAHSANIVYLQAFYANNAMPEATAYNLKRLLTGNKVLRLATANKVSRVVFSI